MSARGPFSMSFGVPPRRSRRRCGPAPGPSSTTQSARGSSLVVLDDDHRVAPVAQRSACAAAARCRARGGRSTARRGCTGRPRAPSRLRRADPLARRPRARRGPPEGQVLEPHVAGEREPPAHRAACRPRRQVLLAESKTACATDSLPIAGSDAPATNTSAPGAEPRAPVVVAGGVARLYCALSTIASPPCSACRGGRSRRTSCGRRSTCGCARSGRSPSRRCR